MSHRFRQSASVAAAASVLALVALAGAGPTLAHTGHEVGDYVLEIGWLHEPAFVGQPNAVQVTITDHHDGSPILDLGADDIKVVVSTAGADSGSLGFAPAFDAVEKEGSLGEYDAALVPTAPGDYSFHITGSIHGTAVDLTVASGDETFDPVVASTDLEFPAKMPSLTEVGTRLDRIDARIQDLQNNGQGDPTEALQLAEAAQNLAITAQNAAEEAKTLALLGFAVGVVGILVAVWALRRPRAA